MISLTTLDDLTNIMKILQSSWESMLRECKIPSHELIPAQESVWKQVLTKSNTYVYRDRNVIVAFICVEDNRVVCLHVDPEYQRKQIGTKLLKYVLSLLNTDVTLYVLKKNKKAIQFYLKNRFIYNIKQDCLTEWCLIYINSEYDVIVCTNKEHNNSCPTRNCYYCYFDNKTWVSLVLCKEHYEQRIKDLGE